MACISRKLEVIEGGGGRQRLRMLVVDIDAPRVGESGLVRPPAADSIMSAPPALSGAERAELHLAQLAGLEIVVCTSSSRAMAMSLLNAHVIEAQIVSGYDLDAGSGTLGSHSSDADRSTDAPRSLPAPRSARFSYSFTAFSAHYATSVAELAYRRNFSPRAVGVIATRPCDIELVLAFGVAYALEGAGMDVIRAADARFGRREQDGLADAIRSITGLAVRP